MSTEVGGALGQAAPPAVPPTRGWAPKHPLPGPPLPASPDSDRARGTVPSRPPPAHHWLRRSVNFLRPALPTLLIAGALCLVTFIAGGGLNLSKMTPVEIGLTLGCGAGIAAAILLAPTDRSRETPAFGRNPRFGQPAYGLWSASLLLALAALSALSVVWSVQPDASWQDAGRLFAYSGVFALAVLLARVAPARWSAVLGGLLLATVVVCGYALLTKVFPNALGSEQAYARTYARLREPYGYWNAIGLAGALGAIACMWLGARRAGHALLNALAYPAMGIVLVTVLLAYSRGALAALVLGLALWLCLVPLRLRGVAVLCVGALGAAVVVIWDFSQHALTTDNMPLARARRRRAPARGPARRDARGADPRRPGDRFLQRPPRTLAADAPARR